MVGRALPLEEKIECQTPLDRRIHVCFKECRREPCLSRLWIRGRIDGSCFGSRGKTGGSRVGKRRMGGNTNLRSCGVAMHRRDGRQRGGSSSVQKDGRFRSSRGAGSLIRGVVHQRGPVWGIGGGRITSFGRRFRERRGGVIRQCRGRMAFGDSLFSLYRLYRTPWTFRKCDEPQRLS